MAAFILLISQLWFLTFYFFCFISFIHLFIYFIYLFMFYLFIYFIFFFFFSYLLRTGLFHCELHHISGLIVEKVLTLKLQFWCRMVVQRLGESNQIL